MHCYLYFMGLSCGASGKESICQYRKHKRHGFDPWVWKIPWRKKWQPLLCSRLENPTTRGPGGLQSIGSQSDTTEYDLVHVHLYFKNNVYGTRYMLSSLVCVLICFSQGFYVS